MAGAIPERSLRALLEGAGFVGVRFHGWTGYRTSGLTRGALVSAVKPPEDGGKTGDGSGGIPMEMR
ncbi:MAG: hypothetical protein IT210_19355 [Armatimonadetes bacterium]|nr:hypothetical protein [Armatimonadota bacterium]